MTLCWFECSKSVGGRLGKPKNRALQNLYKVFSGFKKLIFNDLVKNYTPNFLCKRQRV